MKNGRYHESDTGLSAQSMEISLLRGCSHCAHGAPMSFWETVKQAVMPSSRFPDQLEKWEDCLRAVLFCMS